MNRQQCANKKDSNSLKSDCLQGQENVFDFPGMGLMFSEHDFMDWCSTMTIQDIQIQFRVYFPQAIQYFRENVHEFGENWTIKPVELLGMTSSFRNFVINNYHKFLKALVFTSDKDYLDSLTFSSECFLFPDRIYKLLCNIKAISCHIAENNRFNPQPQNLKMSQPHTNQIIKIQLVDKIVTKIQKNLNDKMKLKFKKSLSEESVDLIQQFGLYWKYCCEQQKNSIWCLGYNDIKKAAYKLLGLNQKFDLSKIIEFINNAQKTSSKQLGDKMFSWKLLQNDDGVTNYMQLVFRQLKDRVNKNNKDGSKYRNKKIKKRKQKQKYIRRNSIDQSSNQTNQTDIQYQRGFDININQIIQTKLQKDILQLSDKINQQANRFYQNRQLGYQRLRHLLGCLNIQPKIYGSCCAGLAIKNSDIDVTIQQKVLDEYFGYLADTSLKTDALFQYLQSFLMSFSCVSNIKIISSASIPIMKFTIDNRVPLHSQYYFSEEIHEYLNKQINNLGPVHIDLTVQTTEPNRRHLGMVSTRQTKQWLAEIPTLQSISIILKNQLANKLLNQTYYGGINTYTLLVMLVAVIRREKLTKQNNIAVVFEKVLKFYTLEFQEDKTGIDLNFNGIFYPKDVDSTSPNSLASSRTKAEGQGERQLEVKDPLGNRRNITRNCYQFKLIKQIFKDIYENGFIATKKRVQELCSTWNPKQNPFHEQRLMEWVDKEMEEDNKFFRLLKLE